MKHYTTSRAKIFLSGALLVFGMFSAYAQESVSLQEAIQKALANKVKSHNHQK